MKINLNQVNGERPGTAGRSLVLCGLTVSLALLWAGCKQEEKLATEMSLAGTYSLVSVDSNAVPCNLTHDGHAMTVKSGVFIITAEGTCNSKVTFTTPSGSEATREVKATYTRQGTTLTMKWEGAGITTGSVAGDSFTMNNEGMIFVYHK